MTTTFQEVQDELLREIDNRSRGRLDRAPRIGKERMMTTAFQKVQDELLREIDTATELLGEARKNPLECRAVLMKVISSVAQAATVSAATQIAIDMLRENLRTPGQRQ